MAIPRWSPSRTAAATRGPPRRSRRCWTCVRDAEPGLDVRAAFLDLSAPRLPDVLAALAAQGHRDAVIVPLLLGPAFHARVDLPALVAEAHARLPRLSVSVSDVLGPDDRLPELALRRLTEAGARLSDPSLGIVLAGAGRRTRRRTRRGRGGRVVGPPVPGRGRAGGVRVGGRPDVPAAIGALRAGARGGSRSRRGSSRRAGCRTAWRTWPDRTRWWRSRSARRRNSRRSSWTGTPPRPRSPPRCATPDLELLR